MMPIQTYQQTTYETCLSVCLLHAVARYHPITITPHEELSVLLHSLKSSRDDFVGGHLDYIARTFPVRITRMVDNPHTNQLAQKLASPGVTIQTRKITLPKIDSAIPHQPIVYLDAFYLFGEYHYPHFVTALDKSQDRYQIFDPWDGKEKEVSAVVMNAAVKSLRRYIKLCPQMLIVTPESQSR